MSLTDFSSPAEACRKISSRADEIEAHYGGAANLVDSMWGLLSPNNYETVAEAEQAIRNNTTIDMSSNDITNIRQSCDNIGSTDQSNTIDTSNCPYCDENKCTVSGNTQTTEAQVEQKCYATMLTDALLAKTNDIESLATAEALQRAQGTTSGNSQDADICNNIRADLSTRQYVDLLGQCHNSQSTVQSNIMKGCADFIDNIQEASTRQYAECVQDATSRSETSLTNDVVASSEASVDQQTISANPSVIAGIIIAIVLIGAIGAGAAYYMKTNKETNEGNANTKMQT